jgi:shikimate kinase
VSLPKSIVLIGFMGAGKSSVGRFLERRTGLVRLDTDEIVSSKFGLSISDIFSKHGEQRFRDAETEALRELSPDPPSIIVTGGGIVMRQENVDILKRLGTIVWLDGNEKKLFQRASRRGERPLLQTENPQKSFSDLLRKRRPLYKNAAGFRVDTSSLSHEEVTETILRRIEEPAGAKAQ